MSQVIDAITQSGELLDNANVGTTETMMEAGGLALVGGTVVAGSILDGKAKKKLSTKIHPSETNGKKKEKKQRPRRIRSRIRSYKNKKVKSCGRCLNKIQEKYPTLISGLLALNIFFKILCYWLDMSSDVALLVNLSKSTNGYVQMMYYFMLSFLILQFGLGWFGINVYFKTDLFKNPTKRLQVGDEVEYNYDENIYGKGKITKVNDDNTYDLNWKYSDNAGNTLAQNVNPSKSFKDYDKSLEQKTKQIRQNNIKRCILLPLSIPLVPILDIYIIFYRPLNRCTPTKLSIFMIQYEALRVLIEVLCESLPQTILQLILYFTCTDDKTCGFNPNETLDLYFFKLNTEQTLGLSLILSAISITRTLLEVYIATRAMGISIRQYIQHLFEVGGGLNLDAIRLNKIESVTYYDLTDDVIDEICNVMKKNKSIKEFNTDWGNLTDEQIKKWLNTGHQAVVKSCGNHFGIAIASEKGYLEIVKYLVETHDGNNNNMTLKEYVNQEGKDSYGNGRTPLMIAAQKEHFQIVEYLIEQGEADPNIADCTYEKNALHRAASNNKKDTELIELLLTNMSLNSINKKDEVGYTPLDYAYYVNESPIQQKIIDLIRSKGGKRREELQDPFAWFVCACEEGRFEDVKLLITGYNDVNNSNGNNNNNMTLKEYVNQEGNNTPLMAAARYEHFQIVKYLIEQGEADPNIADSFDGWNALHSAARNNKKDTELIELLLTNMSLNSINKKVGSRGFTPLDFAYYVNESPIQQKIIDLIRSKGGKYGDEL